MLRAFFSLATFFSVSAFSSTPFPLEDQVMIGTLSNGFTYYVQENSHPADQVFLRLVVKVGSFHETEKEQGAAHLIEHLVFRGTEHFGDEEIFEYAESLGAEMGPDVNAYTSFDSTHYVFDIPLDKPDSLDKVLFILREIAFFATLPDFAIEKERTVVLDEFYQDLASEDTAQVEALDAVLNTSLFSDHAVLGTEESIKTIPPEKLRAFYKKWYRPDRMALIAVGDFDQEVVIDKITALFSSISPPKEPPSETFALPACPESPNHLTYCHPEISTTSLSLMSFYDQPNFQGTEEEVREAFFSMAIQSLLQNRLEASEQKALCFLEPGVFQVDNFLGKLGFFVCSVDLFEERCEEGISALQREISQVLEEGFTPSEWDRVSGALIAEYEHLLEKDYSFHSISLVEDSIRHFENGIPYHSGKALVKARVEFFENTSIEEINAYLPRSHLNAPFSILLMTSSEEIASYFPSETLSRLFEEKREILSSSLFDPRQGYETTVFSTGSVVQEENRSGITLLTLSNGLHVALKPTQSEAGEIFFLASAKSGLSSVPLEELPSTLLAIPYTALSLSYSNTNHFLKSKGIGLNLGWTLDRKFIQGTSSIRQSEALFQWIHNFFVSPEMEEKAWENLLLKKREEQKQKANDPNLLFSSWIQKIHTQDNPYLQEPCLEKADRVTAERALQAYFTHPEDFLFTIVGDFELSEMTHLVKTYLATLPVGEKKELLTHKLPILFPREKIYQEFHAGRQRYATTRISIPFQNVFENPHNLSALISILEQRLFTSLRKQMGNTYGVHVSLDTLCLYERGNDILYILFTSQPECREAMVDAIWQELERLQNGPISEKELKTAQTLLLQQTKKWMRSNPFLAESIAFCLLQEAPLENLFSYEEQILSISQESIQQVAQAVFSTPYHSELVHLPLSDFH